MDLLLVTKEEFTSLYKYGVLSVKPSSVIEFGDNRSEAAKILLSNGDPFEFAQERLFIVSDGATSENLSLKIEQVVSLIPLDAISKRVYETDFNTFLQFSEPFFEEEVKSFLKKEMLRFSTIKGIDALRKVCGLPEEEDKNLVEDIIKGKSFLQNGKYYDAPLEDRTPWSMLIAYNRYRHYPKDVRGFFYDTLDCFMYATQTSNPDFLGFDEYIVENNCHSVPAILESIAPQSRFTEIDNTLEIAKADNNKALSAIESVYGSVHMPALFLYIKNFARQNDVLTEEVLKRIVQIGKSYPQDISRLITLLGGYVGYSWIYPLLYQYSNYSFIKEHHSIKDFETPPAGKSASISNETGEIKDSDNSVQTGAITGSCELSTEPSSSETKNEPESLDVFYSLEGIANRVFQKKCARKDEFISRLKENEATIIQLAIAGDQQGLNALYPTIDKKYDVKKDNNRVNAFVEACFSNVSMDKKSILQKNEDQPTLF